MNANQTLEAIKDKLQRLVDEAAGKQPGHGSEAAALYARVELALDLLQMIKESEIRFYLELL